MKSLKRRSLILAVILLTLPVRLWSVSLEVLSQTYTIYCSLPDHWSPGAQTEQMYFDFFASGPTPLNLTDLLDQIPPERLPYFQYPEAELRGTYAIGTVAESSFFLGSGIWAVSGAGRTSAEIVFRPSSKARLDLHQLAQRTGGAVASARSQLDDLTTGATLLFVEEDGEGYITEEFHSVVLDPSRTYRLRNDAEGWAEGGFFHSEAVLSSVPESGSTVCLLGIGILIFGTARAVRRPSPADP